MRQDMYDIIAVSNRLGHSDIFLTTSCSPNWLEIKVPVFEPKPQNKPDITSGDFRIKLRALYGISIDEQDVSKVIAYISVIEFHKGSLTYVYHFFSPQRHELFLYSQLLLI